MRFDEFIRTPTRSRLDFRVHDVSLCIVNAARRAILANVQCVAFSYDICIPDAPDSGVSIVANTSTLHNEMLAHRFSFIPVHLSENEQQRFQGDQDRFKFSIRVMNKGAAGAAVIDVTSRDILVADRFGVPLPSAIRDAMFPPDNISGDHILIVCLRPSAIGDGSGEEIAIDAIASCSNGQANCRWSPVSLCSFRNVVDQQLADAAYLRLSTDTSTEAPVQSRAQFDTLEAHRCFARNKHGEPFVFDFCIETTCGLRPEFIFFKAVRILASTVRQLADAVRAIPGEKQTSGMLVTLDAIPNIDDFYSLTIAGQGHTLGNLVQGLLYEYHVRDDAGRRLTFVGYHVAHPLDQSICMKLRVVPGTNIKDFLLDALQGIALHLDLIALEWTHPSGLDRAGIKEIEAFLANIPDMPE